MAIIDKKLTSSFSLTVSKKWQKIMKCWKNLIRISLFLNISENVVIKNRKKGIDSIVVIKEVNFVPLLSLKNNHNITIFNTNITISHKP